MAGYDTNNPITVPQMSPYESYHTLRAYTSPSGGTTKAVEVSQSLTRLCLQDTVFFYPEGGSSLVLYALSSPKIDLPPHGHDLLQDTMQPDLVSLPMCPSA